MKTPVAFLIFNRPHTTQKVFEAIRQAKPLKLLVVADGPRSDSPEDFEKCKAARAILEKVDWDCQVLTNYSDVNLGCKCRVSSGLDWVFDQVQEAIILEDDCVPHLSFFRFCDELLEHYREDTRVMGIAADNFQYGRQRTEYSYYFSRYNHSWGWATWKRAWNCYDITMKLWPKIREENWLDCIFDDSESVKYWTKIFQATYEKKINTWDYQWTLACWLQSGLTIIPNVNLVSNIGFGEDATHTAHKKTKMANKPIEEIKFPLQHPPFVIRHQEADSFTQNNHYKMPLLSKIKQKLIKQLTPYSTI